jgi:hypothetical protein
MIRRYIIHVEEEIRLVVEAWQQANPNEMHTPRGAKLQDIVTGLPRLPHTPPGLTGPASPLESNGSG